MPGADPRWSEPKRVRSSVLHAGRHVGYVTTVGYPNRDLTAFPEGTPYSEVVVADLSDRHVALLQRFRQHWLVYCGGTYITTTAAGELTSQQIARLAVFALLHAGEAADVLAASLRTEIERMLGAE